MQDTAIVIIGAGPAGLTAAHELLSRGLAPVVILEAESQVGGLSKTVNYKGNLLDIGGHRFFSKSDWVMNWWQDRLPVAAEVEKVRLTYRNQSRDWQLRGLVSPSSEEVMLVRQRISRIYCQGKFFEYPLRASFANARQFGLFDCTRFGMSYLWSHLFPRRPETTLEDFFVNRFGYQLYEKFFRDYSEKVWGVPCSEISAEWGAQRIKGLSLMAAIKEAWNSLRGGSRPNRHTSLLESFLYPRYGPGQMWEKVSREVVAMGGQLHLNAPVVSLEGTDQIASVRARVSGQVLEIPSRQVISTMPVGCLISQLRRPIPPMVERVARQLSHRDFITVGLLLKGLRKRVPDNWIYIQEKSVKLGRLQIFNNWSPAMVADPETVWVGLEYFCREGDGLWSLSDSQLIDLGVRELQHIGLILGQDVLDGTVLRVPKAYPGYYGSYRRFDLIREFVDQIPNLFLVGRNGMHRYNNQDHSMLTARLAVEAILSGSTDKRAIWEVNVDDDYQEEGQLAVQPVQA